jgi:pyrroloquinoline-quinone synthase
VRQSIWDRIEESRSRWNVLEHQFYVRWSAGELTPEELATYSGQYRHATEAIARLSSAVAQTAPAGERAALRRHASEEASHVALWDGFVEAVGGEIGAEPTPETGECVAAWTADDGFRPGLTRLYAIESGQPAISATKRRGLAAHYDVGDGPGNEYFRLHQDLDREHAEQSRRMLERHLEDADEDRLAAAAEGAFRANWRLLDGVS